VNEAYHSQSTGVKSVASFIPKPITLEKSRRLLCGQLHFPCWHNVVPNSTLSAALLSEFHATVRIRNIIHSAWIIRNLMHLHSSGRTNPKYDHGHHNCILRTWMLCVG